MIDLKGIVRQNIWNLEPYSCARDEFSGAEGVFLDANENPFGELNRYPDPYQKELKEKLSKLKSIPERNIFIGNGSDEIIDLTYRIFCNPGTDKALVFTPTYGMYKVSAGTNGVELIELPLTESFQIDFDGVDKVLSDRNIRLIFVCSPNNPTGNIVKNIETLLRNFSGIVFLDEAYIDFSDEKSLTEKLNKYPNLIVSQTFSKAWGLAGARIGVAYASSEIVSIFNKVKPPYNVSSLNQQAAIDALNRIADFKARKSLIIDQRKMLKELLVAFPFVRKVYESEANFLLVEMENADGIYGELVKRRVITRNRSSLIENCIRITVGSPEENKLLLEELKNIPYEKSIVY